MKYLIAGLGNIGPEYQLTRHNIGFLVLDRLAELHGGTFKPDRYSFIAEIKVQGRTLVLSKPTTFMNLSGNAVRYWLQAEKIPTENLLVVTDDLNLPYGKLRIRPKGSAGGHNGLTHIQQTLATENYARLRFGIGAEFSKGRQVDYVLSNFSKDEMAGLSLLIDKVCELIITFALRGTEAAMNAAGLVK
ncbi:MAG: aminoacyl-tRNA hydrolase [Bacteroidota bacterium]